MPRGYLKWKIEEVVDANGLRGDSPAADAGALFEVFPAEHTEACWEVEKRTMVAQDDRGIARDVTEEAGRTVGEFFLAAAHAPDNTFCQGDKLVRTWFTEPVQPVFNPTPLKGHDTSLGG